MGPPPQVVTVFPLERLGESLRSHRAEAERLARPELARRVGARRRGAGAVPAHALYEAIATGRARRVSRSRYGPA